MSHRKDLAKSRSTTGFQNTQQIMGTTLGSNNGLQNTFGSNSLSSSRGFLQTPVHSHPKQQTSRAESPDPDFERNISDPISDLQSIAISQKNKNIEKTVLSTEKKGAISMSTRPSSKTLLSSASAKTLTKTST